MCEIKKHRKVYKLYSLSNSKISRFSHIENLILKPNNSSKRFIGLYILQGGMKDIAPFYSFKSILEGFLW